MDEENIKIEETKEETQEETQEESKQQGEKKDDEIVVDSEIEEALNLYRALKDPAQQTELISELARRAGVLGQKEELTKKDEKNYLGMIEEVLGQEYPDLKDKLGKVFVQFEKEHNDKLNQVLQRMENENQQRSAQEFDREFSGFLKENKVSESIAAKMLKEIEILPPSVGKNGRRLGLTEYLGKIHRLALMDQKQVDDATRRTQKIQENSNSRVKNLSSEVPDERLRQGSKLPSIREAVAAASRGIKFDED